MWYTVDTRDNKLYCMELQQQRKYWNHMDCVWHCRHKKFFLLSVGTFPPYSSIQLSLSSPVLSSPLLVSSLFILSTFSPPTSLHFLSFLPSHHDIESFLFSSLFFHHIMMSNLSSFPLFSSITSWCRIFPRWWRPFCRSAEVHERVRFRSSQRLEKLSTTHFQIMIRKCDKLR